MLAEVRLLTAAEAEQIAAALDEIGADHRRRIRWSGVSPSKEDIHTHIEQALIGKLGRSPAGNCTPPAAATTRS